MPITETVLDDQPGKLQFSGWTACYRGVFGKIADALFVKRMKAKSLEEGLRHLKALVERQQVVT